MLVSETVTQLTIWLHSSPLCAVIIDNKALTTLKSCGSDAPHYSFGLREVPKAELRHQTFTSLLLWHIQTIRVLCLSAATDGRVESKDV